MALPVSDADRVGRIARAGLDHVALQLEADALMRADVGYDVVAWGTVDPAALLITGCTPIGAHPHSPELHLRNFDIEHLCGEPLTIRTLLGRDQPVASLRDEVLDIERTRRYQEFLAPYDFVDELVAVLRVDGRCWGAVRAYRHDEPFTARDRASFASVSGTLAAGLRRVFLHAATEHPLALDDPPGMCTLDREGRVVACTRPAHDWLDSLMGEGSVTAILQSLAGRVAEHGDASAVAVGRRGPIALHATCIGADGEMAVVIERPRPIQLTPRIMEAYGLTAREMHVTELVLRGLTTAQIAHEAGISRYTVQDHLKSIFAKVGVQTRGELAHEIYVRFYLPPKQAGMTPGPYGYFLGL